LCQVYHSSRNTLLLLNKFVFCEDPFLVFLVLNVIFRFTFVNNCIILFPHEFFKNKSRVMTIDHIILTFTSIVCSS
jgi:hypothetical protein